MKVKQIVPDYFPEFKCLADKCNYTCCYHWDIFVTKSEYTKLKNFRTKDKELKKLFENICTRVKDEEYTKEKNAYARFKLKEDGYCPFLTEDKMCGMQRKCGYNMLTDVCKRFPRISHIAPSQTETVCSLACEQTVNLLLERSNSLRLIRNGKDGEYKPVDQAVWQLRMEKDPRWYHYSELQALCIGILQNRKYPLAHRLLLLGFVARDLDKAQTKEETWKVITKALPLLQYDEKMAESLKKMPLNINEAFKLVLLPILWFQSVIEKKNFKKDAYQVKVLEEIKQKLCLEDEFDSENEFYSADFSLENYFKAKEHFESLEYTDYLMENILVQLLLQKQFPLKAGPERVEIWKSYMELCCEYNVFKGISMMYMLGRESKEDMAHVITICGRTIVHNAKVLETAMVYLEQVNQDNLEAIAQLIQI